ncbi:unnamed protein product [Lactuca saligna]|uniref:Replication factor A C-terminal domain-containing protein n=1 Tax=Lactuca saligna TaxID=75948 RepID=A0AA36EGW4_LACSI|nr:unnamed protein product [Lactuca saligna]
MAPPNLTLIADVDGNKIQATVSKRSIYRFKNVLKDGMSFYINDPNFAALKSGSFKLTPHDQKLTLVQQTVVTECSDFSGSEFGFSFVDYQTVLSFSHPLDTSVDIMGLVIAIAELQRDDPDKTKHKLNIHIQDAKGLQIRVNLWGDYAYKMQDYIHNNPYNRRIVVILQFGQINVWRDRPSVNTYFTSSKLFINSDIHEVNDFIKSLDGDDRPDSSTNTSSVIKSNQLSEYDDFIVKNNLKAIAEVLEPVENLKWYYLACTNCFGKAVPSDEVDSHLTKPYKCHNKSCTKTTTSLVPRFMIPICVQDNTGTLSLTMFEREGKYLLKQSAKELLGDNLDFYPEEVNALKGTDDNITPSTVDKNETTSPMKSLTTTPVLKRNLEEVFDLELNDHLSSSKTPKISPDGLGKQLLKVKLEKND